MHGGYPRHQSRKIHCLDGIWDFAFLGDVDADTLQPGKIRFLEPTAVPCAFDALPAHAGKRGLAAYSTRLSVRAGMGGRLQFGSVSIWCRVFVDGKALRDHGWGYTEFWIDIPPSPSEIRELVVLVDNRFDFSRSPLQEPYFDFYHYGGILRSVHWHEVPDVYLATAEVTARDYKKGDVTVKVWLGGTAHPATKNIDVSASLNANPEEWHRSLVVTDGCIELTLKVEDPRPWSPASPFLHTLRLTLGSDDLMVRFGLRDISIEDGQVLLNGNRIKLLGYCRHEAHPQFGPALPLAQIVADLQILKDMGCNFIRGSHYPQDQRFLDLCDEMGFLVWEENMAWQQKEKHFTSPAYRQAHVQSLKEMVAASINHPSVIMWGFFNEGESHREYAREAYEESFRVLRELDSTRLITYASMYQKEDLFFEQADIICLNIYPGWYEEPDIDRPLDRIVPRIRELVDFWSAKGWNKPFFISEIGAEGLYGWHDAHRGYWTEEYQADYLGTVCDEVVNNDRISGVSLWQFVDCRTYQGSRALNRARAFNNKGSVDEFRRPKMAYGVVKEIFRNGPRGHARPDSSKR